MYLLDVVVVGVAPVHGAGAVVQSQAVGPQHVGRDEDAPVGAVHPRSLDAPDAVVHLVLFPVRPVHPAVGGGAGGQQIQAGVGKLNTYLRKCKYVMHKICVVLAQGKKSFLIF